jgi:ribulose-5-phosphate 4-epimerase/fuculose-1-phosphate aldolase
VNSQADREPDPDHAELRETIATACRIMAECGLVEHVLGHISARVSAEALLVRCRGPEESGLAYTTAADIRLVPISGPGEPGGSKLGGSELGGSELGAWTAPNELPIHTEVLRRRPDVTAVVHAHPPAVVAVSLLGVPLLPIYGAYDIPGARLAAAGIAGWPNSSLISTQPLAAQMADALGESPVVVLRGHGLVSVAPGPPETAVAQAVLQAVAVDTLARTTLEILRAGGTPAPISAAELAGLPDLGGGFNVETMWRHLRRRTEGSGRCGS